VKFSNGVGTGLPARCSIELVRIISAAIAEFPDSGHVANVLRIFVFLLGRGRLKKFIGSLLNLPHHIASLWKTRRVISWTMAGGSSWCYKQVHPMTVGTGGLDR
jgi:hypothetical protein